MLDYVSVIMTLFSFLQTAYFRRDRVGEIRLSAAGSAVHGFNHNEEQQYSRGSGDVASLLPRRKFSKPAYLLKHN